MDQQMVSPDHLHVLIIPLPVQGHVNSMLKLSELLCLAGGIHVSFLIPDQDHARLLRYTDVQSRFNPYPGFRFQTFPELISQGQYVRSGDLMNLIGYMQTTVKIFVRDLLASSSNIKPAITCIIADGLLSFSLDVAEEVGVPVIYFRTISACSFWAYFCIPKLAKASEIPFKGDDMDVAIHSVLGMESFLRRRDLPSFCRDTIDDKFGMILDETQQTPRAKSLILNTFEDLEGPTLSHIRAHCPDIYTIGPLHLHLKARLASLKVSQSSSSSNSLLQEDKTCLNWLDNQPSKSVIYVSFGSLATVTRHQLMEFWHGLVNSGMRFLWVIRPDSVEEKEEERGIPAELEEGTKARGYLVAWAPQEEVLSHRAVGGFLTHSGWNSTLESIVEGVPMICWPYFADQQMNSRFVGEVWKLGLDIKDSCDREIIEKAVRDLMEARKDEFGEVAEEMARSARKSVGGGGSSSCNLDRLIGDIKLMSLPSKASKT